MTLGPLCTFTIHDDETVSVNFLPPTLKFRGDFLAHDDIADTFRHKAVRILEPGRLEIVCENARCTYRLIEDDPCLDVSTWQAEGG